MNVGVPMLISGFSFLILYFVLLHGSARIWVELLPTISGILVADVALWLIVSRFFRRFDGA